MITDIMIVIYSIDNPIVSTFKARPSRTSFGMRMRNMNILNKNVMRYGHILRQDLRPFGVLKFLNLLSYRLIFLIMRLSYYPSVSIIQEMFLVFYQFYVQNNSILNKSS
jgi:hypothetical protein